MDDSPRLSPVVGTSAITDEPSSDKFTARARPAVVWMGNVLILWNYCIVPVAGAHWHLSPASLPDAFWWTWGTVVTGYVLSRSAENIAKLPGESQINLGGIVKIGNKS